MYAEYCASVSDIMFEPCTSPPISWWPHHWCPSSCAVTKYVRSTSVGFSIAPMKPMPSENGTVFGKDCAKVR